MRSKISRSGASTTKKNTQSMVKEQRKHTKIQERCTISMMTITTSAFSLSTRLQMQAHILLQLFLHRHKSRYRAPRIRLLITIAMHVYLFPFRRPLHVFRPAFLPCRLHLPLCHARIHLHPFHHCALQICPFQTCPIRMQHEHEVGVWHARAHGGRA